MKKSWLSGVRMLLAVLDVYKRQVFFLPHVYEMLRGHCHFCLIQVHDILHYSLDVYKRQTRSNADEYEKDSVADFVLWKSRRPEDGDNFLSLIHI